MPHIHIDEVITKDKSYPMLVNFQNGYTTDIFKKENCIVLDNEQNKRKSVATELCDLLYAGEENEEQLGKTLLLARNKKTGKVRLIEVGSVDLKPIIKADTDTSQLLDTSYLELSRKFGSKKHKKMMEQKEKLKVNVETVTTQMHNVTANITEDQLDLSAYNKTDSDFIYIPPINRDATKVDEVYDLDQILTSEEYEKIHRELEGSEYKTGINPFLRNIIVNKLSQKQTVLAVYASSLLQLFSTLARDIGKKTFVACPYSATLNQILLTNFLSNNHGKRGKSGQLKDKSLCYALVFILLINNYKFDIEELCQYLKLTPRSVATKALLTGATIATVNSKKVAHLKLPLSKPAIRRKSAKF